MSAHSTIKITRTAARRQILDYFASMGDEELKFVMDRILDGRLYNCRIVGDEEENDDELLR